MSDTHLDPREVVIAESVIRMIEAGGDPDIDYGLAEIVLPARGFPLTGALVRALPVTTWVLSGKNCAPASRFLAAAEAYVRARRDKPNRKVAAAAVARADRGKAPANDGRPDPGRERA